MCCSDLYPGNLLISLASKGFVTVKVFEEKLVGWKQRNPTLIYERQEISTHQIFFQQTIFLRTVHLRGFTCK